MRILLIDDTRDTTVVMRILLERLGFEVEAAADAKRGLELANSFAPDVVCVDIGLPSMDGYDVARRIRQNPRLKSSRVIAISGYAPNEARVAESGIDTYLIKPASLSQIVMALHN